MLPEKWAVKLTDNVEGDKFMRWYNSEIYSGYTGNAGLYYANNTVCYTFQHIPPEFQLLTIEQFFKMKDEQEFTPEWGKKYVFSDSPITIKNRGFQRIYLGKLLNGNFISSVFNRDDLSQNWKYCNPIIEEPIKEVTLEEVPEKFGVKEIKIKQ